MDAERKRSVLIVLAGALGISFSPVIAKLLGSDVLGHTAIGFWRTLIGGIALMLISRFQGHSLRMERAPALWCILTGIFFSLDLGFWHRAIILVGSGMSTLIGNTAVFITSIASYVIFKEKLSRRFIIAAPVGFIGLALLIGVFDDKIQFSGLYLKGIIYSLMIPWFYAFYMVGIKKASNHSSQPSSSTIMTWICFSTAVFMGIGSIFEEGEFMPPDLNAVFLILLLGLIVQGASWWGIATAMKKIAIHHASLILLAQPALSVLWGYLFFNETLGGSQIIGVFITLSAIYMGSMKSSQKETVVLKNGTEN